jgi:hypothetical protein
VKGFAAAVVALAIAGGSAPPRLAGCPLFPTGNPWNSSVDSLPVAADSAAIIATIGADRGLHPDFGSGTWDGGPIGIPYNLARPAERSVYVSFDYAAASDPGPYPFPKGSSSSTEATATP